MSVGRLQSSMLARDGRQSASTDFTGGPLVFCARKPIMLAGEVAFDVPFPYVFTQPPNLSSALELEENEHVEAGDYPTLTTTITRWVSDRGALGIGDDPNHRIYRGARIAAVITGPAQMRSIIHLRFEGLAIVGPFAATKSASDPI